ncbi:cryptochrome/photolyase family protein [Flavobacterium cerinum]|uniref:DNA photolyase family protein n=1 Tax=Flavobacterium cerinum TaxID=2502784 RepID=A0ABY5IX00_9FLAO|nr:deoxyribodipyrimidine photo-lyase [Flavobacterium cerinum]UUC47371.1 DNA photolyase family protein [Flavobacterium cerinum]
MQQTINIFWFRRDLRLTDNIGLFHALNSENPVLPIFIFDTDILSQLPADDARVSFIYELLTKIQQQLSGKGKSLAVFYGEPVSIFRKLITENQIRTVYTNHDYEPSARKRDTAIYTLLKENDIAFKTAKDQVIFEKKEIVKDDGTPYVVYTPYSKKWKEHFYKTNLPFYPSETLLNNLVSHSYPFPDLGTIGFRRSEIAMQPYDISDKLIEHYEETRNFPAISGTSMLGPHLRFGAVSIRQMARFAATFRNQTFLNELIWREFFMQILWHFPHTVNRSFKEKYDAIQWSNDETLFQKWCDGKTGYPFVDAGMRELNATGHMHNRVRMIVASFLCKHLLIDWRWGETYFAQKLLDYEQASNVGNWQWAAGSGVDAAPYFRIFNPTEQIKKFDKNLDYIKKWIPELGTAAYPLPIVDHKTARERCLTTYKKAVG